jgi:hypothetical protein
MSIYCAPLFDLFLHIYRAVFCHGLFKNKDRSAKTFNSRYHYIHDDLSLNNSVIIYISSTPMSLIKRILPISKICFFPWHQQWRKMKNKTMRQTWWLHFSISKLPIHQKQCVGSISVWSLHLVHVYAILGHVPNAETLWKDVICWHNGYSNKPTLFLGGNHCSTNSTVDIMNRLPNCYKCFSYFFFSSFQNHGLDFNQTWVLIESLLLVFDLCIVYRILITHLADFGR